MTLVTSFYSSNVLNVPVPLNTSTVMSKQQGVLDRY